VGGSCTVFTALSIHVIERPLYSVAEAARLLRLPARTLRRWLEGAKVRGRYYNPVIRPEPNGSDAVTWAEFIEAGLLGRYRDRDVPLIKMRPFIDATRVEFGVPYPLAHFKPLIEGRELVYRLQEKSQLDPELYLVHPAKGGQLQWAHPVADFLKQVEFAPNADYIARLYPLGKDEPVVIDPEVSFGIPQVRGVRTELILESLDAGESIEEAATSWGLRVADVKAAAEYERGLAA
jgi:uncharacterized protein (DUF433 family)